MAGEKVFRFTCLLMAVMIIAMFVAMYVRAREHNGYQEYMDSVGWFQKHKGDK